MWFKWNPKWIEKQISCLKSIQIYEPWAIVKVTRTLILWENARKIKTLTALYWYFLQHCTFPLLQRSQDTNHQSLWKCRRVLTHGLSDEWCRLATLSAARHSEWWDLWHLWQDTCGPPPLPQVVQSVQRTHTQSTLHHSLESWGMPSMQ